MCFKHFLSKIAYRLLQRLEVNALFVYFLYVKNVDVGLRA